MPAGNHRSPLQKPFSTDVRGQRFSSGPQILMAYVAYTSVLASCPFAEKRGLQPKVRKLRHPHEHRVFKLHARPTIRGTKGAKFGIVDKRMDGTFSRENRH